MSDQEDEGVGGQEEQGMMNGGGQVDVKNVVLFDDTTDEESKDDDAGRKRARELRGKRRNMYPAYCQRNVIIHTARYLDEFVLEEYETIDVRGSTIITGFYTESFAAGLAAKYVVDELNLPLIGTMYAESGMPVCVVNASHPAHVVRIYGNRNLVVFLAQKILESAMNNAISYAIYDFARRHHCSQIIALEAFQKDLSIKVDKEHENVDEFDIMEKLKKTALNDKPQKLRYLTNDESCANILKSAGHKKIRGAIIMGVTGGIIARASTCGDLKVVALICPYNPLLGQSRASILLVKMVNLLAKVSVDTKTLEEDAEELESQVKKEFDKAIESKPIKHPSMYI
jgi:predicted ATP-grasp superfamily ATP-dependent carboligase